KHRKPGEPPQADAGSAMTPGVHEGWALTARYVAEIGPAASIAHADGGFVSDRFPCRIEETLLTGRLAEASQRAGNPGRAVAEPRQWAVGPGNFPGLMATRGGGAFLQKMVAAADGGLQRLAVGPGFCQREQAQDAAGGSANDV